jgi:hypothetical protein
MKDWLDKHLVPEWRKAWGMASVQLAAVVSAAVGALAAQPHLMLSIVNYMPADPTQRAMAAIGVGAIAFFGPTVLRLWKQGKANEQDSAS